ncbi:MAG: molybdopterin-dependent oxidoreductase [Ktedonobacteraceae bacterium]
MISLQKKPTTMIVHQAHPLNAGSPLDIMRESFFTPQQSFFIRNHGTIPTIDGNSFRLSVTGMVERALELSLDELRAKFPFVTVPATLQCAGSRRDELTSVRPIPGELPWGAEPVSTSLWGGVPLRNILQAAGIATSAAHVAFIGMDEIQKNEQKFGFGGSIPIEKALSAEVLLAYEMNGEPLTAAHGFPLRMIVPGYIGARSVKWLANIHIQDCPSHNYYQTHAYKLFPDSVDADNVVWEKGQTLAEIPLNAVICQPQQGAVLTAGPQTIRGYALARAGHYIERVELSIDEGKTWTEARLLEPEHRWAWRFWESNLSLDAGTCQIIVRAWDTSGQAQPVESGPLWNFKGYLNNAWYRCTVFVQAQ